MAEKRDGLMELRPYQTAAAHFLQDRKRAILALDMGLGKTAIALTALTPDRLPALVVAPKRVAESVWPTETRLWRPDLSYQVAAGDRRTRWAALHSTADLHIIGRDNLKDVDIDPAQPTYRTLILDELSGFKSRSSQRWAYARALAPWMENVWGLTGTPAPNGVMDLWAQVYLMDGGERLGHNITTFRSRYFTPGLRLANGVIADWNLKPGADKAIYRRLEDIMLSMSTEGRVALPEMLPVNRVVVSMTGKARDAYRRLKRDLLVDLTDLLGEGGIRSAANAAVLTSRLSQVTAGFLYGEGEDSTSTVTPLHREKVSAVQEIVDGTGSPILVFYRYQAEKDMLLRAIPGSRTIDSPDAMRDWNAGRIPVLLAHPAAAAHGLNLQYGGHTIVWTTPTWSLEEWQQANKRLHRSGQTSPVTVHVIVADRTIDDVILSRLQGKSDVQQSLLEHLESPI